MTFHEAASAPLVKHQDLCSFSFCFGHVFHHCVCVFKCRTESTHTLDGGPSSLPFSCLLTFQSDIWEKAKTTEAHTAYIANAGINRNVCAVG